MSRWRRYHFTRPPASLRRPGVKRDNLALVPASLLPFKDEWQQVANRLPDGEILIVLPDSYKPQRRILQTVAALLQRKGQQVTILPADYFPSIDQ